MKTLINKSQALRIAYSLLKGEKTLDDYGFTARQEAAVIINDMIELEQVEQELTKQSGQVKPVTISDFQKLAGKKNY